MTQSEFFGDWYKCINPQLTQEIMHSLLRINGYFTPSLSKVFNAFVYCPYNKLSVVFIGQDPYPQKGVATGLAFANEGEFKSPSLKILKSCVECLEFPDKLPIFAPDLIAWAQQGVLLLNSSLTCLINQPGTHSLMWKRWMRYTVHQIGLYNPGLVWVLFGQEAQTLEPYIGKSQHIIKVEHPAYLARTNRQLPPTLFSDINKILLKNNNLTIKWYEDYEVFH